MLTEDYINIYFDIHIALVNSIRTKILDHFKKGTLEFKNEESFKVAELKFLCEHKHIQTFKNDHNDYFEEYIKPTTKKSLNDIEKTQKIIDNSQNNQNDDIKSTITQKINKEFSFFFCFAKKGMVPLW
jgi:hypothetical protein